jgi:uncharacterized damage-inducible protein DinB
MQLSSQEDPPVLGELGEPGVEVSDLAQLVLGYLDWYRATVMRKIAGLSDAQLRTVVDPLGWSPLGMIKHLGWVERRWMRWGFAAESVRAYLPGGDKDEWGTPVGESTEAILAAYLAEVELSRALADGIDLHQSAAVGGRFRSVDQAPSLGRILYHLLQEYARHVGQLDVARELIDGETGE